MKFKNCFIDDDGSIWGTTSLIKNSMNLPVFQFEVKTVCLDEIMRWTIINVRDYCVHFKRVRDADLTKPIILRSDGYIMDGWHRIIKALTHGVKTLPAKQFEVTPTPDFTQQDEAYHKKG